MMKNTEKLHLYKLKTNIYSNQYYIFLKDTYKYRNIRFTRSNGDGWEWGWETRHKNVQIK